MGVLVDTLLEQGFPVFAINPKQLDRFRDRFTAGGAKDDRRDAHVGGRCAAHRSRARFDAFSPTIRRSFNCAKCAGCVEDLQEEEQRLANRLREQLYRVDAAWLTLSPAADEPWLWTLLADTPHPARGAQLPRRRIAPVLRAHRIRRLTVPTTSRGAAPAAADRGARRRRGGRSPDCLAGAAAAPGRMSSALAAERRIDRLLEQLAPAEATDGEPREHRDVEILQSLPGVGRMVAATMLTEATGPLADRDYATLRAHAGAAPVTKRSGKRAFFVHMRYACKPRLAQALYHWARTSIQHDAAARAYYDALRARGHSHARALRSVADRWLRILIAMLQDGNPV